MGPIKLYLLLVSIQLSSVLGLSYEKYPLKAGRPEIKEGQRQNGDELLFSDKLIDDTPTLRPAFKADKYCYPAMGSAEKVKITSYLVKNLDGGDKGGVAFDASGGVGQPQVCVFVRSQWDANYHFQMDVYGIRLNKGVIGTGSDLGSTYNYRGTGSFGGMLPSSNVGSRSNYGGTGINGGTVAGSKEGYNRPQYGGTGSSGGIGTGSDLGSTYNYRGTGSFGAMVPSSNVGSTSNYGGTGVNGGMLAGSKEGYNKLQYGGTGSSGGIRTGSDLGSTYRGTGSFGGIEPSSNVGSRSSYGGTGINGGTVAGSKEGYNKPQYGGTGSSGGIGAGNDLGSTYSYRGTGSFGGTK